MFASFWLTSGSALSRNNSSRSRPNSRLQDRLAKAVNKGSDRAASSPRASSDLPSRPETPALKSAIRASVDTARASTDSKTSEAIDSVRLSREAPSQGDLSGDGPPTPSTGSVPLDISSQTAVSDQPQSIIIPEIRTPSARPSVDSVRPPSLDLSAPAIANFELAPTRSPALLETELSELQKTHKQTVRDHREEVNTYLERIDALQSKLKYLTQQLTSQAKATAADSKDVLEKKVAEKDAQIAALMDEGQNLSKNELRHLTTIKKLRAKGTETEKETVLLKQRLSKAEKTISEVTERVKRAEAAEKAAQDKLKIVDKIEKDFNIVRAEREEAGLTIAELRRQLSDALSRAEDAETRAQTGALEAEKRATASLRDDIENMRIEKKLAEDRAKRELQQVKEEAMRNQEKAKMVELELKGEISVIQPRHLITIEIMLTRPEPRNQTGASAKPL